MREFSPFEKELLEKILRNTKFNDLRNISLAKLIHESIGVFAITFGHKNREGREYIKIYSQYNDINEKYFLLISLITSIKWLSDEGYVLLLPSQSTCKTALYCVNKYRYKDGKFYDEKGSIVEIGYSWERSGLSKHLSKYANMYIFPTGRLVKLMSNDFKTEEQIRFETQLKEARRQTHGAYIAAGVSFLGLFAALVLPFLTQTSLKEIEELKQVIQSAMTERLAAIETKRTNDTITVDIVNPMTRKDSDASTK